MEESRLLARIETLYITNRLLEQKNEQLHRRLRQSVEVTPERLERLLLTGIGEMLPYETLQTYSLCCLSDRNLFLTWDT